MSLTARRSARQSKRTVNHYNPVTLTTRTRCIDSRIRPFERTPRDTDDFENVDVFWATSRNDENIPCSDIINSSSSNISNDILDGIIDVKKDGKSLINEKGSKIRQTSLRLMDSSYSRRKNHNLDRVHLQKERERYEKTVINMSAPNFNIGHCQLSSSSSSVGLVPENGGSTGEIHRKKGRFTGIGSWVERAIRANMEDEKPESLQFLSPSDLSRVSTIPPTTPESALSNESGPSTTWDRNFLSCLSDNQKGLTGNIVLSRYKNELGKLHEYDREGKNKPRKEEDKSIETVVHQRDFSRNGYTTDHTLNYGMVYKQSQRLEEVEDMDQDDNGDYLGMIDDGIGYSNEREYHLEKHNEEDSHLFPSRNVHSGVKIITNSIISAEHETTLSTPRPSNAYTHGNNLIPENSGMLVYKGILSSSRPKPASRVDLNVERLGLENTTTPKLEASMIELLNNTKEDSPDIYKETRISDSTACASSSPQVHVPGDGNDMIIDDYLSGKDIYHGLDKIHDGENKTTPSGKPMGDVDEYSNRNVEIDNSLPIQISRRRICSKTFDDIEEKEKKPSNRWTTPSSGALSQGNITNDSMTYSKKGMIVRQNLDVDLQNNRLSFTQIDGKKSIVSIERSSDDKIIASNVNISNDCSHTVLDTPSSPIQDVSMAFNVSRKKTNHLDKISYDEGSSVQLMPNNVLFSKDGKKCMVPVNSIDDAENDFDDKQNPILDSSINSEHSIPATFIAGYDSRNGQHRVDDSGGSSKCFIDKSSEQKSESTRIDLVNTKKKKANKSVLNVTTPNGKISRRHVDKRVRYATPPAEGYAVGNREYNPIPVESYTEKDEGIVRRSKRARFPVLAWWKNERLVYEAHDEEGALGKALGNMPVVTKVIKALPTPYKKRTFSRSKNYEEKNDTKKKGSKKSKHSEKNDINSNNDDDVTKFDSANLRKKYNFKNGEIASIWNEEEGDIEERKIFCYCENMVGADLPINSKRCKGESDVVGRATQAFNVPSDHSGIMPGWIAGNLLIPPTGIKDAEGVGLCAQVFNVHDCEPESLEVAIADPDTQKGQFVPENAQRFLLSKGDMFHVPAGNIYRIENHSRTKDCTIFWTIVRPMKLKKKHDKW